MLAQSFKTATQLKINDEQLDALRKTLVYLETEQVEWIESIDLLIDVSPKEKKKIYFNMEIWSEPSTCGTVACIGGTAEALAKKRVFSVHDPMWGDMANWGEHRGLKSLFNPCIPLENITVKQAARALRNYLTLGRPHWRKVVSEVA